MNRWASFKLLNYPSTSDHDLAVVEDGCLAGRNRALRFIEAHQHHSILSSGQSGGGLFGTRANFDGDVDPISKVFDRYPIEAPDQHLPLEERVTRTDHHTIVLGIDLHDI